MKKLFQNFYIENLKEKQKKSKGFITMIGLLIVVTILGIWFVKTYSTPKAVGGKTQIETYNHAIKDAENAKKMMETRTVNDGNI